MKIKSKRGLGRILYAKAVYGREEIAAVVKCLKAGWLGPGEYTAAFEKKVATRFGKRHALFLNSGSSANFFAVEIANLPKGSEIITQACTFPTTLSPIIQHGHMPVFVDSHVGTYQANLDQIEAAISKRTRAIMVSHLLGNLNDMVRLRAICDKHHLILIEDSCDTIGNTFRGKPTGQWSDITTTSFYAGHHMTSGGGGGMVLTDNAAQLNEARVLTGWGRALPEKDDRNIRQRFGFRIGNVSFDGRFTFVAIGYNFKGVEMQAAFGLVQLEKLARFNKVREHNFARLLEFFRRYEQHFILPKTSPGSHAYWLAFPLTIRETSPIERRHLLAYLEQHNIQTRLLFSGNILRHPAYRRIRKRIAGPLTGADMILERSFLIGCHHGLTEAHLDYMISVFDAYLRDK
ncbi:DegT/DnrJ/EryC1/StrS family aminotransferase [Candidatus Parcubacteria bacterium]|nr:DegT/DnrJ/EryC1/StrS family aminotransferase [Candidatus Parcubacteria bacterium]